MASLKIELLSVLHLLSQLVIDNFNYLQLVIDNFNYKTDRIPLCLLKLLKITFSTDKNEHLHSIG